MNYDSRLGDIDQLIDRFKKAKDARQNWDDLWRDAYDYAIPHKQEFISRTKGEVRNRQVYDSTAVDGVDKFAARVKAALCPAWGQWAKLTTGSEVDGEGQAAIPEAWSNVYQQGISIDEYLEEITGQVFEAIWHSNFDAQSFEAFQDLSISCGALLCEYDEEQTIRFKAVPLIQLYLEDGPYGRYETVYRHFEVTGRNIERLWPKADVPAELRALIDADPAKKHWFIEGTIWMPGGEYAHIVIDEGRKHCLFYESYGDSSPWLVFGWRRSPGELYSRGPVIQVLPDIMSVNKMKEFILQGAAWKVFGLWTGVDDGVWNPYNIELEPGQVIPVGSNQSTNPSIMPLQVGGDLMFSDWLITDLQRGIQEALFANPLGDIEDTPVRTLGENMMRMRDMLERSGASFGVLERDMAMAVVKRVLAILTREGKVPPLPKVDGKSITVKMQSPIAQARDSQQLQSLVEFQNILMQTIPPEQLPMYVKQEELVQYVQEQTGVPEAFLRDEEERKQFMENAAAMAQEAGVVGGE